MKEYYVAKAREIKVYSERDLEKMLAEGKIENDRLLLTKSEWKKAQNYYAKYYYVIKGGDVSVYIKKNLEKMLEEEKIDNECLILTENEWERATNRMRKKSVDYYYVLDVDRDVIEEYNEKELIALLDERKIKRDCIMLTKNKWREALMRHRSWKEEAIKNLEREKRRKMKEIEIQN